jgi:hypothetical protein
VTGYPPEQNDFNGPSISDLRLIIFALPKGSEECLFDIC